MAERAIARIALLVLALGVVGSGCALLDEDPRRVTMAELIAGAFDPESADGVETGSLGARFEGADTFCEAAGMVPLRWTVDALVPMQLWVDTYSGLTDVPDAVAPSVQHLVDFTRRRLRWSLSGVGDRPTWDAETIAAAESLIDTAITSCPDLPMVIGPPRQSQRPSGWSGMTDEEVADHCAWIASRFEEGVVQYEIDHGRPPRHHMELDLPIAYYGESDFHGLVLDEEGRPRVVPVPGGACDPG